MAVSSVESVWQLPWFLTKVLLSYLLTTEPDSIIGPDLAENALLLYVSIQLINSSHPGKFPKSNWASAHDSLGLEHPRHKSGDFGTLRPVIILGAEFALWWV